MAAKISTGLAHALLVTGSAKGILDGGFLKVYSGAVPATADAALGDATLLLTYTESGDGTTGLTFSDTPSNRTLAKEGTESWEGEVVATGVAAFYRWEMTGDSGNESATDIRLQGTCGNINADMIMSNTTLTITDSKVLNSFFISLPAN